MEAKTLRSKIGELIKVKHICDTVNDYDFECLLNAYDLLMGEYCPFHEGDRVRLKETPVIDENNRLGWGSAKHFLIKGAPGIVESVTVNKTGFHFDVSFDNESWIDDDGKNHTPSRRHTFYFAESMLEKMNEANHE